MFRPARLVIVLAVCAAASFGTIACGDNDNPTQPTPPPNPNEVFYAAVGASDALGAGGSVPCVPYADCADGTGYVQVLTRRLRTDGKTVELTNLGLPGLVLAPEVQAIGNALGLGTQGNFLVQELPFVPRDSTLVTVFAGGNDINTIGEAVQAGQGGSDPAAFIATQVNNFGRDMRTLIGGIRDRAPNARIVVLNLPNFAGLPLAAAYTLPQKRLLQQIAVGFSAQINAVSAQGALVIDLMCDARSYVAANYSSDGFHPADPGYAFLADLAYTAAVTGAATPPRASCPQMTLF